MLSDIYFCQCSLYKMVSSGLSFCSIVNDNDLLNMLISYLNFFYHQMPSQRFCPFLLGVVLVNSSLGIFFIKVVHSLHGGCNIYNGPNDCHLLIFMPFVQTHILEYGLGLLTCY